MSLRETQTNEGDRRACREYLPNVLPAFAHARQLKRELTGQETGSLAPCGRLAGVVAGLGSHEERPQATVFFTFQESWPFGLLAAPGHFQGSWVDPIPVALR
jgi:hypothetical protein